MTRKLLQAVPPEFHGIARHYIRQWKLQGWSEDQQAQGLQFGVNYTGPPEVMAAAFQTFATKQLGLAPEDAALATNAAEELRDHINTKGFEGLAVEPADEVQGILDDIRTFRRQWPNDVPKEMEAAELRLLDAQLSGAVTVSKPQRDVAESGRLAEIRALRRDDPHAWESNKALQAEELALIEAGLPDRTRGKGGYRDPGLADIQHIRRTDPARWERDLDMQATERRMIDVERGTFNSSEYHSAPPPQNYKLEQIRELRRNDPAAYDADKGMQARELSLIEASLPAAATGGATSEGTTADG